MGGAGHAEHLADDHGAERHRRLVHRGQCPHALADGAGPLRLGADEEAGLVDEVHHRAGGTSRQRSTKRVTFSDASAVQPAPYTYGSLASTPTGQPSRRANPVTAERPQRAPISSHEPWSTTASMMGLHLVDLPTIPGDGVDQPLIAALGVVVWLGPRREAVDARREVRQEAAGAGEGFLLGGHHVVDRAVDAVDVAAAELLLGDVLAEAGDHWWPGHEDLRGVAHHEGVVAMSPPGRRPGRPPSRGPAPRSAPRRGCRRPPPSPGWPGRRCGVRRRGS